MEITGNKYLHKKFKKQTSCSPIYNVEDKNDNVLIPVVSNGQCGEIYAQKLLSSNRGSTEKKAVNFLLFKDNNYLGSVPNVKSTNYDGSLVTDRSSEVVVDSVANDTLDNQSSISKVAVSINVATTCSVVTKESEECKNKYRISDEANIVRQNDQKNMMNLVKTSNVTSCISTTTTTTTSLLANELKENIRNFSFDTEVNISEPSTQKHDKSSIFDTVYSKYSVISELPNATGIKSDMDEMANKSSGIIYNKSDTSDSAQKPEAITPEKKQNCPEPNGGKYVCTYCNLACSKPSVLQKHIRAHTNERPYPCVSCGFSFKTRSNLYKHCRSRTHANRVMGNKHVQAGASQMDTMDIDSSLEKNEDRLDCADEYIEDKPSNEKIAEYSKFNVNNLLTSPDQSKVWEQKSKPYKPRFHTAKIFFEENKLKENDSKLDNVTSAHFRALPIPIIIENIKNKTDSQESQNIRSNPDILKLRINELIHKNNSIMNCDDAVVIRRRNVDTSVENVNNNEYISQQVVHWQQPAEYKNTVDEPLNLTAKNRKRCLSDSDNTQKSLIKELLLKNLSTDPNLQCPYCKMIFQTVTELEMHKLKYCNAKTSNIRYARSSSVNVASILTQNKNAFDNIPHMQHTTFPLKSPGPCLGKTRLIENEKQTEKYRTFSFDDNVILHHTQSDSPSFNKYMLQSAVGTYPLSPQIKKNPIRLFGGEVKITQTSGETRSFKIESESINKMQEEPQHFMEFSANLSENLVIKSGLHSGGTVLQNKTNYSPKIDSLPSPNILRMYDNSDMVSPSLNLQLLNDKPKFTFDNITQPNMCQNDKLLKIATNEQFTKRGFPCRDKSDTNYSDNGLLDSEKEKELYKSNLIDFGQKACKLLAPNLKTPNIKLSGLPISLTSSDKIYNTLTVTMAPSDIEKESPIDKQHLENLNFAKKQISLQQKMAEVSQSQHVYNPMNLFVNGKVIPYVPGIPGPVADFPTDHIYNPMAIGATSKYSIEMPNSPRPIEDKRELKEKDNNSPVIMPVLNTTNPYEGKTPTIIVDYAENLSKSDTKSLSNKVFSNFDKPVEAVSRIAETKTTPSSATVSSPDKMSSKDESRRFVRPTSLALKPTLGTFKSHHGLTPTMLNQALISPDTPRVAKKYCQQYLNGNYFSYLGLKSSTKSVYCTLNKTQPFYVKHFKKLSMYSEWRQQESKIDSLSVSAYDSRQQQQKYTMAGHAKPDFIAHSSYKFIKTESSCLKEDGSNKSNSVFGGYESNEDYTYIRGRGRGRYVCEQCGIRCKKPSMLKKHIRTHSDDRPYTCEHCNFRVSCFCSFKTKGNLTKHMKSKAHSKKYAATSSTLTQNSVSTSSDSDESDEESSDESTRLQEHEAAHCLLSLAHKNNQPFNITQETNSSISSTFPSSSTTVSTFNLSEFPNFLKDDKFLKHSDEISQVTNTNFAKNKILDETSANFLASKHLSEVFDTIPNSSSDVNNVSQYLGESEKIRPLTYPYLQTNFEVEKSPKTTESSAYIPKEKYQNQESITTVSDLQRPVIKHTEYNKFEATSQDSDTFEVVFAAKCAEEVKNNQISVNVNNLLHNLDGTLPTNIVYRKRKLSSCSSQYKVQRSENVESNYKAVDLRVLNLNSPVLDLSPAATSGETFNGFIHHRDEHSDHKIVQCHRTLMLNQENQISDVPQSLEVVSSSSDQHLLYSKPINDRISEPLIVFSTQKPRHNSFSESNSSETFSQNSDTNERIIGKIIDPSENSDKTNDVCMLNRHADRSRSKTPDYLADQDQSAMQTLAEIAIKRVKLEKNILAKNVASEYLKLALNCDSNNTDGNLKKFVAGTKETVNELIVKPEDNKNCSICSKNFSKPSQLRLHMNIHYLERPFRCETCSVSFRTKGHLQKHERSASHHNKLSTSPALSSSEPRPFKCTDCNIAFRIHGHLAKHLRSKMHIMKLECLSKIPFGLYAELERANSLLTEINTTDGDLCLESLKILARKLFSNDPNKLDQVNQSDRQDS